MSMRLISEVTEDISTSIIEEAEGTKSTFIEGIFAQAELPNRNHRVYPKRVLESAIDSYQELVKANRALGELNHPCCYFYNNFKVLTPNGWKPFTSVDVDDDVFCMNENRSMVVGKVIRKIAQPVVNQYAYHIKGKHIDSTVTGNHRFYCLDRNDNIVVLTAKQLYENNLTHYRIIKNFIPKVENKETYVVIPGCKFIDETSYKCYKTDVRNDLVLNTKDFCAFLGFWLAEGSISNKKYRISVYQNSGEVIEEYKSLLRRMGIQYNTYIKYKENQNSIETVSFSDRRIHNILKPLGTCYNKYIPEEYKNLPPEALIELLNWFAKGDGRKVINGSSERKKLPLNVFSTSKRLIEDLNEIALKCGLSGKIHKIEPNKNIVEYNFADHTIKTSHKHALYQFNISNTSGIHIDRRFIKIEREFVKSAFVYCLETTYGNFYIEDKNKQYLTGNSPTVDPERACIKIEKLTWDGNNVIGKARVLSTPKGKLLEALIRDKVQLGVSTRGLGSVHRTKFKNEDVSMVGDDYQIRAIDVVHNPSGIDCFVDGILENVEFYYNKGILCGREIELIESNIKKNDVNAIMSDFKRIVNKIIF